MAIRMGDTEARSMLALAADMMSRREEDMCEVFSLVGTKGAVWGQGWSRPPEGPGGRRAAPSTLGNGRGKGPFVALLP